MNIMMYAHGGSLNRGCEAIVRSSANIIKTGIEESAIYLVSEKPETDKMINQLDHIYDGAKNNIKQFSYQWFFSLVELKLFGKDSYALSKIHKNVIRHIDKMDVCLSIGGDNYCYGEQPGLYEINKKVKEKGKKLVLWACSIGEEDISETKLKDLKNFDLIIARESLTYSILKNVGVDKLVLCADPAFTLGKRELELPYGWKEGNTLGLNFSPLVANRNSRANVTMTNFIKYILDNTDLVIALTPHVMESGNNDYEILYNYYKVFKDTGRVIILPDNLNALEYKGYISRMRFFIGARTHATIAAYSSFVPTMVLGYSVKSKGIARDIFGEEKLVMNINEISDVKKLREKFSEMMKDEKEIRYKLEQSIPLIKEKSLKAVEYLYQLVK